MKWNDASDNGDGGGGGGGGDTSEGVWETGCIDRVLEWGQQNFPCARGSWLGLSDAWWKD